VTPRAQRNQEPRSCAEDGGFQRYEALAPAGAGDHIHGHMKHVPSTGRHHVSACESLGA
jgi:hypothetical protein